MNIYKVIKTITPLFALFDLQMSGSQIVQFPDKISYITISETNIFSSWNEAYLTTDKKLIKCSGLFALEKTNEKIIVRKKNNQWQSQRLEEDIFLADLVCLENNWKPVRGSLIEDGGREELIIDFLDKQSKENEEKHFKKEVKKVKFQNFNTKGSIYGYFLLGDGVSSRESIMSNQPEAFIKKSMALFIYSFLNKRPYEQIENKEPEKLEAPDIKRNIIEWQWRSEAGRSVQWKAYNKSLSEALEIAFQRGNPEFDIENKSEYGPFFEHTRHKFKIMFGPGIQLNKTSPQFNYHMVRRVDKGISIEH